MVQSNSKGKSKILVIISCSLLAANFLIGCSAGLLPPNDQEIPQFTRSDIRCQDEYRHCAIKTINDLLTKIENRQLSNLPVSPNCKLTQNTKSLKVGDGFFRQTAAFKKKRIYVDTTAQEAMLFSLLRAENGSKTNCAVRFKIIESMPENYTINELEIISGVSIIPDSLYPEDDPFALLEQNQTLNREQLISLGHKYFDSIEKNSHKGIPLHSNAMRIENGYVFAYGRFIQAFQMNSLYWLITGVRERHIFADEGKGIILANVIMDHGIGNLKILSTPIAEIITLEGSKIRYIEAIFPTDDFGITSGWNRW